MTNFFIEHYKNISNFSNFKYERSFFVKDKNLYNHLMNNEEMLNTMNKYSDLSLQCYIYFGKNFDFILEKARVLSNTPYSSSFFLSPARDKSKEALKENLNSLHQAVFELDILNCLEINNERFRSLSDYLKSDMMLLLLYRGKIQSILLRYYRKEIINRDFFNDCIIRFLNDDEGIIYDHQYLNFLGILVFPK